MLKKPAKATRFYSDSRDHHLNKGGLRGGVHSGERLAGQPGGLSIVALYLSIAVNDFKSKGKDDFLSSQ